jgi:methylated-DNA-[protein]-cysteine S-methyltransferase
MWTVTDSPVGPLRIIENAGAITAIEFEPWRDLDGRPRGECDDEHPLLVEAVRQLEAYFARDLKEFDLALAPAGSAFQQRVWEQLRLVGFGETAS